MSAATVHMPAGRTLAIGGEQVAEHVEWCTSHVAEGTALIMCRSTTGVVETVSHQEPMHVTAARWLMAPHPGDPTDKGAVEPMVEIGPNGRWMFGDFDVADVMAMTPAAARALAAALVAAADLLEPPASARASRGQARGRRGGAR